jgi:hypothetical protein
MAKLNINVGASDNDKTGDTLRTAFTKVNANFTELYAGSASESQLTNGAYTVSLASTGALTLSDTGVIQAQGKTIYALAVTDDGTTNTTINNYIRVSINWQANSSIWPTTGAFVIALAQGGTLTGPTNDNAIFTATITSAEYVSGNVFKIYTNRTGNMKRSGRYYIENVSGALDSVVQLQVRPDSLIAFPNGGGLRSESKTVTSSANGPITDLKVTNLAVFPDGAGLTVSNQPYGAPVGLNLSTSPSQTSIVNVLADSIYLQVTEQSTTTSYTNAIQITKDALTLGDVGGQNKWQFGTSGSLTLPDDSVIASYKPVTVIAQTSTTRTIIDQASASYILFTETVDTANAYANGVFTAPYTGYYQFNVSIYFSTSVTLNSGSFFLIDHSDSTKRVTIMQDVWSGRYLHYSTVVQATAGDTISCFVLRNASGANIELASGCRLTIHRVSIS